MSLGHSYTCSVFPKPLSSITVLILNSINLIQKKMEYQLEAERMRTGVEGRRGPGGEGRGVNVNIVHVQRRMKTRSKYNRFLCTGRLHRIQSRRQQ